MNYFVLKGCHYSNFIPNLFLVSNFISQGYRVTFDESCKYEIEEESCVNKLFGFCFGFGVHHNSVRFGWTYNKETNNVFIWKYIYLNGKLQKSKIFSCEIGSIHDYNLRAVRHGNFYDVEFIIDNKVIDRCTVYRSCFFVTSLGLYFGGNSRAPHIIKVKYE
jgi:hypothetical protein